MKKSKEADSLSHSHSPFGSVLRLAIARRRHAAERTLSSLSVKEARWSWIRLAIFIGAIVAETVWALRRGMDSGWIVGAGVILFILALVAHGRVQAMMRKYRAYIELLDQEESGIRTGMPDRDRLSEMERSRPMPRFFQDLDLLTFLDRIDRTFSRRGASALVQRFRQDGVGIEEISRRQRETEECLFRPILRRRILLAARVARSDARLDSDRLEALFATESRASEVLPGLIALALIQVATWGGLLLFRDFRFLLGLAPILLLQRWIESRIGHSHSTHDRALELESGLKVLASVSRVLESLRFPASSALSRTLAPFHGGENPSRRARELGWIVAALSVRSHPLIHFGLNLLLPWDSAGAWALERMRRKLRGNVSDWLDALAQVEAAISLADWAARESDGPLCFPEYIDSASSDWLIADDVGHPMIPRERRVLNPVRVSSELRCGLITGSNMSGKSTYLRTVGINLLLGRAGAPVIANSWRSHDLDVMTCLRVADSLEDQISSFYAEVLELKSILDRALAQDASRPGLLYLIDEIFRGTNNRERLLGSRAYLRKMISLPGAAGFVATHDLELAELAQEGGSISNFHFRETIEDGKMKFHYKIAEGPCPSTNALRVMELAGLPV